MENTSTVAVRLVCDRWPTLLGVSSHGKFLLKQKVKRAERVKREKETLKAAELGLEPPPKKIPKVNLLTLYCTRQSCPGLLSGGG